MAGSGSTPCRKGGKGGKQKGDVSKRGVATMANMMVQIHAKDH